MYEVNLSNYIAGGEPVPLGHQGEESAVCLITDLTDFRNTFGEGSWQYWYRRPNEVEWYVAENTYEIENNAVWILTKTNTANFGEGRVELRYYSPDLTTFLAKTDVYAFYLKASPNSSGDEPEPPQSIIDEIFRLLGKLEVDMSAVETVADNAVSVAQSAQTTANSAVTKADQAETDAATAQSLAEAAAAKADQALQTDPTLSVAGMAADAAACGVLKSALNDTLDVEQHRILPSFVEQHMITNAGTYETASKRMATPDYIDAQSVKYIRFNVNAGYQFNIAFYSAKNESAFISPLSKWQTGEGIIPITGKYFRLTYAVLSDSRKIELAEAENINISFIYTLIAEQRGVSKSIIFARNTALDKSLFEVGSFNASGGNSDFLNDRSCRAKEFIKLNYDIRLIAKNYKFDVAFYNSDYSLNTFSDWVTERTIPAGTVFRFCIRNSTDVTAMETLLEDIEISVPSNAKFLSTIQNPRFDVRNFEQGTYNGSGQPTDFNKNRRCRSISFYKYPEAVVLIPTKYRYSIMFLTDGVFDHASGLTYSKITIPANTEFNITIANDSAATTVEELVNDILIFTESDYEIIKRLGYIQANGGNCIYQCREGSVSQTAFPPASKYAVMETAINEYDRIRFSVRKTTDGHFVCIHDATINRVARNMDGSAISGSVSSDGHTLAELNQYDWGIAYGAEYAGLTVPTLDDSLCLSNMFNLGVTIEFNFVPTREEVSAVFSLCAKYNAVDTLIVIVRNTTVGSYFKELSDKVSYYFLRTVEDMTAEEIASLKTLKTSENRIYIQQSPLGSKPTAQFIELVRENGFHIYYSYLFSIEELKALGYDCGVTLFETANVPFIKTAIREYTISQITS